VKKGEAPKLYSVDKGATLLATVPMIVIVNQETASGGEFMAAALRDGRKAEVIGQKTFGKWTVQTLDDLPNGYAVKYTTSVFETPKGETFDGVGLSPDVEVDLDHKGVMSCEREKDLTTRMKTDTQLRAAVGLLKER
jgi:C-terminal processing protease CtpA/Prc